MKILDQEKMERIKALLKTHPRGLSITNLASITGLNRNLIAKYLDMLVISGQVEIQQYGPAKVYFLSQRIPVSAMIEITSDLVMVLDQDRRIVHVNKPFTQFLGLKRENLLGMTIGEVGHPFLSSLPNLAPSSPTDMEGVGVGEISYPGGAGESFFRIKRAPAVFEDGAVGLTLIIEDITESKKYQENLRLSEARYRGIVQDQTEFIIRFLPDTTLTFVNEALSQFMNSRPGDLVGKRAIDMLPDEERPGLLRNLAVLTPQNPTGISEQRIRDGRGQMRWVHWTNRAIFDDRGIIREIQGIGRDITDQRETAEKISRYILQLEFISRKALEFVHPAPDTDIYPIIAAGVRALFPEVVVVVSSFDPGTGEMKVEAMLDEKTRFRIREILGKDPVGIRIRHDDEILDRARSGTLTRIPGESYLIRTTSPAGEAAQLQQVIGSVDTYLMGLTYREELLGEVVLFFRQGSAVQHEHLLVTYLNQASVAVQRQIIQEELRKSQEQYRRIIETAGEGIWVLDRDYRTTFVNPRLEELLGYTSGELAGRQIEEFMLPEDIPAHRQRVTERKNGKTGHFEQRFRRKDGSLIWALANATPLFIEGEFTGAFAMLTDITAEKITADDLQESEERYRTLVEQAHDMVVVIQDGVVKFCNRRVAETWGGTVEEILGQPFERFIDPEELPRVRENYIRRMAGEEVPEVYNTLVVKRDGSRVHVDLGAGTILFEGRPADLVVMRDITEKKRAEEQLKQTHDLQQAILHASPVGIGLATNKMLTWANSTMDQMLGYEPGEVVGQPSHILFADDDEYQRASEVLYRGLLEQGLGEVETVWKRKDGSMLDIYLTMARAGSDSPDMVAVAADITDRKKAEEELKRTHDLQQAILNASPVGIGLVSNQALTWANEAMYRMLGIQPLEMRGQHQRVVFADEEEYERVSRKIYAEIEEKGFGEAETALKRKDGSIVSVSLRAAPIRPGSTDIIALVTDITERKKAEEELKKIQSFQQTLLNASPVGIGVTSNRVLLWSNEAMLRITGYDHEEVKGQPARMLYPDDGQYERVTREISRAIETRTLCELDTVWKKKDGSLIDVRVISGPIRPGSPEVIAVAQDITARKKAEEKIRESEEIFRTIVSISPLPISLINAKGKYLYVNPAFTQLFGYTLEDVPDGKAWFSIAYPDEDTRKSVIRTWKADEAEQPDGMVRPRTFQVRCKDGSLKDILFLPASTHGGLQVVVCEDITGDRIHARLRESEDLYRHLVDDLNIGIYRSTGDPEGKFIWGNTGLIAILGFEDLADLKGMPVRDLFQKPTGRKALLKELQEKKFVKNRLLSLKKKDGTPVKVSVTALAEFDEKGNVRFITGLVQQTGEKAGS